MVGGLPCPAFGTPPLIDDFAFVVVSEYVRTNLAGVPSAGDGLLRLPFQDWGVAEDAEGAAAEPVPLARVAAAGARTHVSGWAHGGGWLRSVGGAHTCIVRTSAPAAAAALFCRSSRCWNGFPRTKVQPSVKGVRGATAGPDGQQHTSVHDQVI
jgi:hypothetical protein